MFINVLHMLKKLPKAKSITYKADLILLTFIFSKKSYYPIPKNLSKNTCSFWITPCFFSARFSPPKRDIGGISLSIAVPLVFTEPSRKATSINFRVSSSLRFSSLMIETSYLSFSSAT